jgi:hypothetical protein
MKTILTVVNGKPKEATVSDLLANLRDLDPTTPIFSEFSDGLGQFADVLYLKVGD